MRTISVGYNFRFTPAEMEDLDQLVFLCQEEARELFWSAPPNRTNVIKMAIRGELARRKRLADIAKEKALSSKKKRRKRTPTS